MKRLFAIFAILAAMSVSDAYAQFTVEDQTKTTSTGNVTLQNPLQDMDISTEFSSAARARMERLRLRKERNYVELSLSLQGSMTSYNDAWLASSKGGSNTMSILGTFGLKHTYTFQRFSNNTQVNARYGYNRQNYKTEAEDSKGIWFKNIDEFWAQIQRSENEDHGKDQYQKIKGIFDIYRMENFSQLFAYSYYVSEKEYRQHRQEHSGYKDQIAFHILKVSSDNMYISSSLARSSS